MQTIINEDKINKFLAKAKKISRRKINQVIQKALKLKGLSLSETAALLNCADPKLLQKIFSAARQIKEKIYGRRLVIFAPLYVSNYCINDCCYCGFRRSNRHALRKALSQAEIRREVLSLENEGHKRILLVAGEDPKTSGIDYLKKTIATIYATRAPGPADAACGEIRRLNVNAAPMTLDEFKRLKKTGIGTYQLFQETYHRQTYAAMHPSGPKKYYDRRLGAINLAMQAGIDDVGIGALFGLYDYKFEVLALLMHAQYLEKKFGVGPHTISVPRLEPAEGAPLASSPPHAVSDKDFMKIIAVLRLAVPYTGLILSTRETAKLRDQLLGLGISQISAGSRTNPGGYATAKKDRASSQSAGAQFTLGDTRNLAQVIRDIAKMGYVPSFCTACYRRGRTGKDFMDLAKPGLIQKYCLPNALLTYKEYLTDFGDKKTRAPGDQLIQKQLSAIKDHAIARITKEKIKQIEAGKRDLYF
ncbi:MAG: [FeFe] hydrogenase H-cluster radical SAM maturase HydG [Candidatus Margulisiibacteriota bacterium]